jgi:2,3-dihydroxyphenylpropionate 1,2-dioxygenase
VDIVGAFACSHSGLVVSRRHLASQPSQDVVSLSYGKMGEAIAASRADAVVVIGTDHGRIYSYRLVPAFTVGVGPTAAGNGDGGLPKCTLPIHQPFAQAILTGAIEEGVDLAYSEAISIDHSFVMPLVLSDVPDRTPIVPIATNCFMPPLPTLERFHEVGEKLGRAMRAGPPGKIVVIATGGLSHWVGQPAFQAFQMEAPGTRLSRVADVPMELDDTGRINTDFDREFLTSVCTGQSRAFARDWNSARIAREAGNGAHEIRNWVMLAGILGDSNGTVIGYTPEPTWLTGTAVVQFAT